MELWIRSQNRKELVAINNLVVIENRIVFINNGNGRVTLGTYKTEERALEVLEDINAYKDTMHMLELSDSSNISVLIKEIMARTDTFTYLMPKE